jgi:hypothetical protein
MADPRDDKRRMRDPEDADGQSTRPAGWPGIPSPEEEHQGSLSTHPETKDPPARVTREQKDLEREEHRTLEEWEDDKREEDELK